MCFSISAAFRHGSSLPRHIVCSRLLSTASIIGSGRGCCHRRTWWGRAKLSLICPAAQSQYLGSSVCASLSRSGRDAGEVGAGLTTTCLVVDGLSVASSLQRGPDGCRTRSESCTGDAEGVHDDVVGQLMCTAFKQSESYPPVGCRACVKLSQPWYPSRGESLVIPLGLSSISCYMHFRVWIVFNDHKQ